MMGNTLLEIFELFCDQRRASLMCPVCNSRVHAFNSSKLLFRCSWAPCNKRFSLLSETIFGFNRIPILKKLRLIQHWIINTPVSSQAISEDINRSSIFRFLTRMNNFVVPAYLKSIGKIGGPGIKVEIDETKIGKRKYNRGHPVDGVWVVGFVERSSSRKIMLIDVERRDSITLTQLVCRYVEKGSIIYTDCWRGYNSLSQHGYIHITINHSKYFVDPITKAHTNTIEGNWCSLKRSIPIRCRTRKLIKPYLVRYMIIRNEDCALKKILEILLQ